MYDLTVTTGTETTACVGLTSVYFCEVKRQLASKLRQKKVAD